MKMKNWYSLDFFNERLRCAREDEIRSAIKYTEENDCFCCSVKYYQLRDNVDRIRQNLGTFVPNSLKWQIMITKECDGGYTALINSGPDTEAYLVKIVEINGVVENIDGKVAVNVKI